MNILIVDDGDTKVAELLRTLERMGISDTVDVCNNANSAKGLLQQKQYALTVVDLCISVIAGGSLNPQNGIDLLNWIKNPRSSCKKPWCTFGLTVSTREQIGALENSAGLEIITYKDASSLLPITSQLRSFIELEKAGAIIATSNKIDIALLCALDSPEFSAMIEAFPESSPEPSISGLSSVAKLEMSTDDNKHLKLVLCSVGRMGSVPSSYATSEIIRRYNPRLLILGGIAGGIPGRANLGDLLCAETVTNFQGGKIKGGEFMPDALTESMSPALFSNLSDKRLMSAIVDQIHLKIRNRAPFPVQPTYHLGQAGCSDLVVADANYIDSLKKKYRQMCGIEMEGYGVGFTVQRLARGTKTLMIKSVCDLAGEEKDDRLQPYCALMSFLFIKELIMKGYIYG